MLGIFFGLFAGMAGLVGLAGRSGSDPLAETASAGMEQEITSANAVSNGVSLKKIPTEEDMEQGNDRATPPGKAKEKIQDTAETTETVQVISDEMDPTLTPKTVQVADASTKISIPESTPQFVDSGASGVEATNLSPEFSGSAVAGRVKTFDLEDPSIAAIKILDGPEYGNVTVNPDNTLALVLSGTEQTDQIKFGIQITYENGEVSDETVEIDVVDGLQDSGWGLGEGYMLETDENDNVIVEHGDVHRKVYVSGDDDALSLADIAALENIKPSDVNAKFFANNPDYGASEEMALDAEAGMMIWNDIAGRDATPGSHWLLFEKGYEYEDLGRLVARGYDGESELHPLYIGAYGEGSEPVLTGEINIYQETSENVVFQGVQLGGGATILDGSNILFDDVQVRNAEMNIQNIDGFTLRNSSLLDIVRDEPVNGEPNWEKALANRESGIFIKNTDGLLVEGMFADHLGWADDYDHNLSLDGGQPPSMYTHNFYIQHDNLDVTFRDNVTTQAASSGALIRSGGFIENNVFIDANVGLTVHGGDKRTDDFEGNYSLISGNVFTSGAHKEVALKEGGLTAGIRDFAQQTSLVNNIVTHMADPNNPEEQAEKNITHDAVNSKYGSYFDNTLIYNWGDNADQNTDGLDSTTLNETTIQLFTSTLLGDPDATIQDLAAYLRLQDEGVVDAVIDAEVIATYFKEAYGFIAPQDLAADTLRFIPNDLGEGVRWDNSLNWDKQYVPTEGQNVDLGGNWVNYGGTSTVGDLDMGSGGLLRVTHGRLDVDGVLSTEGDASSIEIDRAGQFWTDGYSDADQMIFNLEGGRFANTGTFEGSVDMTVSDNAQAILATSGASFNLRPDSTLTIEGDTAKVGFDAMDGGTSVLRMDTGSTLAFETDDDGHLGQISEFRSGHFGEGDPNVQSGVNLGDATLKLDLTGLAGQGAMETTLIKVDEIVGSLSDLEILGLDATQDALLTVDYDLDTVKLSLGATGSGRGATKLQTIGDEASAEDAAELFLALTSGQGIYSEDPPEVQETEWELEDAG